MYVRQAHRLSQQDITQTPVTTTTPDDVFYILKTVLTRLLSTGSINALKKTADLLRDVMDRDYNGIIRKKLDDVYRNAVNTGATARVEKAERENRIAFLVRPIGCQARQLLTVLPRSCSMTLMSPRHIWTALSRTYLHIHRSHSITTIMSMLL